MKQSALNLQRTLSQEEQLAPPDGPFNLSQSQIQLNDVLFRGRLTEVYSAKGPDDHPLIVKRLRLGAQTQLNIEQLRKEFNLLHELRNVHILRAYGLLEIQGLTGLVLEDVNGVSLQQLLDKRKLSLSTLIDLMIQWTKGLAELHIQGIIHRDINPQNVLVSPDTLKLWLIDFGLATRLSRQQAAFSPSHSVDGTLAYIAPEQTGRTAHGIDERSDLYSLGASFYEILTGEKPFRLKDASELVYAHLAKVPTAPHALRSGIPLSLSLLVMKLLEKNPESRYRGALGIVHDLEKIREQIDRKDLGAFPLASHDTSLRLSIPKKIYGRKAELDIVRKAWDDLPFGQNGLVILRGESGEGKTALVEAFISEKIGPDLLWGRGKHEELGRDLPYDAIIQASRELVRKMQSATDDIRSQWLRQLLQYTATNQSTLVAVIPEMIEIYGPQSQLAETTPKEAKQRLQQAFLNFFMSFTSPEKTLLLFLDDLQWADVGSLEIIAQLAKDQSRGRILIIGTCRNSETASKANLSHALREWPKDIKHYTFIQLAAIDVSSVSELLCDALQWNESDAAPLAQLIYTRTKGNPFSVRQLLRGLYQEGLIEFSSESARWVADLDKIRLTAGSDQILGLITARLRELPDNSQKVIGCAAYFGYKFDRNSLASALGLPQQEVQLALKLAEAEQLIIAIKDSYEEDNQKLESRNPRYQFIHDRIVEASQLLLPSDEILPLRLRLARVMLAAQRDAQSSGSYEIASLLHALTHFAAAEVLVDSPEERMALAKLFCDAAEKVSSATAWEIAAQFFHAGLVFLPKNEAVKNRNLYRSLLLGEGSCAMLTGNSSEAEENFRILLENSANSEEAAEVQLLRCRLYTSLGKHEDAIQSGLAGLLSLGEPIRRANLIELYIIMHIGLKLSQKARRMSLEEMLNLPTIEDPRLLLTMRLFSETIHPCLFADAKLGLLLVLKQANFMLLHGHSIYSAQALLHLLIALNGVSAYLASTSWGFDILSKLVVLQQSLQKTGPQGRDTLRNETSYRLFLSHFELDFRERSLELFGLARKFLETGDLLFTEYSIIGVMNQHFSLGGNVSSLIERSGPWKEFIERFASKETRYILNLVTETLQGLASLDRDKVLNVLGDKAETRQTTLKAMSINNRCFFLSHQSFLYAILGDFKQSYRLYWIAFRSGFNRAYTGNYRVALFAIIFSISIAHLYEDAPLWKRLLYKLQFGWHRRLLGIFIKSAPHYVEAKLMFHRALRSFILKKPLDDTIRLLFSALKIAKSHQDTVDEAFIAEFLGKLLISNNLSDLALAPLQTARSAYERWGVMVKVDDLNKVIVNLNSESNKRKDYQSFQQVEIVSESSQKMLDSPTLIKASSALSREIRLSELKKVLLNLTVENAGARQAALLWRDAEGQSLRLLALQKNDGTLNLEPSPSDYQLIPQQIIQLAERGHGPLIVGDISTTEPWQQDLSLRSRGVKSIFYMPISFAGRQARGAIYLENDLLSHAFTPERVQVLSVLAGQIAISLENAFLYTQLNLSLSSEQSARLQEQEAHLAYIKAEDARRHLQAGLEAAEAVQKSLLVIQPPSAQYELDYLYYPAEDTGGDWLSTFHDPQENFLYLCLGDVTGHGIPSALVTAAVAGATASIMEQTLNRSSTNLIATVQAIATAANSAVVSTGGPTGRLMTMAIIGLNLTSGDGYYLNAGHLPVFCMGEKFKLLLAGGEPLGISTQLKAGQLHFQLKPGDRLFLHSDGLIENHNSEGKKISTRALKKMIETHHSPQELIEQINPIVSRFVTDHRTDDTACLSFRWKG